MIPKLVEKFWRGTGRATPRYRDELGEAVSLSRLLNNGPRAVVSGMGRLAFGYRPKLPWISYDASEALARILDPSRSRVLEFGSGMSTAWYAERAARVVAIESNRHWYQVGKRNLAGLSNVELIFAPTREAYLEIPAEDNFDLVIVDGEWRDECVDIAVKLLAKGGVIFLDNSDKQDLGVGNVALAREKLVDFARRSDLPYSELTDFAPTAFFVQRALWIGPGAPA
ncbi:O-methyltransferase [Altererythrobacter sp. MF3-039]|uniref:O-methyltransferase n=1 Tax=Altererythrobacter sp. MF3-039 TaxID=3252901 RepID=UPI00390CA0FF